MMFMKTATSAEAFGRKRLVVAVGVGMSAIVPAIAAPAVEYSAGHADIGVEYEGGLLVLHYHFGDSAVLNGVVQGVESEYAPHEAYTRVPDAQKTARPAGAPWDFLGTPEGADLWLLPQHHVADVAHLGVAAEELDGADWIGSITSTITDVVGPAGSPFSM